MEDTEMSDVLKKKICAEGGFNLTEISYDASGAVKLDVEYAGGEICADTADGSSLDIQQR